MQVEDSSAHLIVGAWPMAVLLWQRVECLLLL